MNPRKTTSAVAILALFDLLTDHGLSLAQIEARTGIRRSRLTDPDDRIFMEQFLNLWQMAEEVSRDPAIGLHLRQNYGKRYMHFTIMIATNSQTLLESVKAWSEYAMLVNDTDRVEVLEQQEHYICAYACDSPQYENRWLPEHHFSYGLDCARRVSGADLCPVEICFKHKDPGYREDYEKIFRCPVHFGRDENLMVVRKENMMQPIISPDPYLKALLSKHADRIVAEYTDRQPLTEKIKHRILENLHKGSISAHQTSDEMHMDRSTLHRRLKQEGTSFKALVTEIRKDLARKYLIQGESVSQTAYLVGYTEPSAFHHAFKRWFGINPGAFRKNLISGNKTLKQHTDSGGGRA